MRSPSDWVNEFERWPKSEPHDDETVREWRDRSMLERLERLVREVRAEALAAGRVAGMRDAELLVGIAHPTVSRAIADLANELEHGVDRAGQIAAIAEAVVSGTIAAPKPTTGEERHDG